MEDVWETEKLERSGLFKCRLTLSGRNQYNQTNPCSVIKLKKCHFNDQHHDDESSCEICVTHSAGNDSHLPSKNMLHCAMFSRLEPCPTDRNHEPDTDLEHVIVTFDQQPACFEWHLQITAHNIHICRLQQTLTNWFVGKLRVPCNRSVNTEHYIGPYKGATYCGLH